MTPIRGLAAALRALACLAPAASAGTGSFSSSDPLLDQVYAASVKTAGDMVSDLVNLWPDGCHVPAGGRSSWTASSTTGASTRATCR